jgi:hypothetical protein
VLRHVYPKADVPIEYYDWAVRFETKAKQMMLGGKY